MLRDYLKHSIYEGSIANLDELKTRITQQIHSITAETFQYGVENDVLSFHLVGENGGNHILPLLDSVTCLIFSTVFSIETIKKIVHTFFLRFFVLQANKNRFFLVRYRISWS